MPRRWQKLEPERIFLSVLLFFGLLLFIEGVWTYRSARIYLATVHQAEHDEALQTLLDRYMMAMSNAETGRRGYLLSGQDQFLSPYQSGIDRSKKLEDRLKTLLEDGETGRGEFSNLRRLGQEKRNELIASMNLAIQGDRKTALKMVQSRQKDGSTDPLRLVVDEIRSRDRKKLLAIRTLSRKRAERTGNSLLLAGVLLLIFSGGSFLLLSRTMKEKRRLLKVLETETFHDRLTGLPNRKFLMEFLEFAIPKAERKKERLAIFFIDLDGFKAVNDRFGHAMGDRVLMEVTRRFMERIRSGDVLVRMGGDEFVVCLQELSEGSDVEDLASRLIGALSGPILPGLEKTPLSCSIGISLFPDNSRSAEGLLRLADAAMYQSKGQGKGRFSISQMSE